MLRLKRDFVRFMSHEIRSPLNVAYAGLELLKRELVDKGASRTFIDLLDEIYAASGTAIEILNDMLQYEHIDSGSFKLELSLIPLRNFLTGRLGPYKYIAAQKHISLHVEDLVRASEFFSLAVGEAPEAQGREREEIIDSEDYSLVYIDKFRFDQIIRNLLTNAVKFTPEGGSISIRLLRTTAGIDSLARIEQPVSQLDDPTVNKQFSECLRIEVVDNGAGFQLFFVEF